MTSRADILEPLYWSLHKVKNDYFSDINQSQSPNDTVTEIMIVNDVTKDINLKNEVPVNVESDEATLSLGEVCKNRLSRIQNQKNNNPFREFEEVLPRKWR